MQSQGSTSTQPSFDSIGSTDSLLFSDSEQAEDDTDVFLTDSSSSVIICGTSGATTKRDNESESSGSQWTCDSLTDKEEEEESSKSESVGKASHVGEMDTMGQAPKSQGDLLFAQKCAELQGFVRPLLELLNGLKKGRFDYGLSSFQQSVAMDRIQRIVGVLQRPDCGENLCVQHQPSPYLQLIPSKKLLVPLRHTSTRISYIFPSKSGDSVGLIQNPPHLLQYLPRALELAPKRGG
ncbi:hypothetical protein OJAV_G00160100 [Oryzias javanicus]|uniref:Circadian associated repressor of transcription n=1 Tax=Oryzias javanicus TaxID=123683 RepID=A0A3S2P2P6_ORYJA|nr:hypothetical protein OJAV_G00160100 [Oryzias javanicus]